MIAALAVAALALDVPYLPQTDALCGGAAAAMVFRYWGDAHADPQEFAPLVDRRAGGIADNVLVDAVRRRGWVAQRIERSRSALAADLAAGHPVIVLLADRGARYHYVVVTGDNRDGLTLHDPSWGPARVMDDAKFDRLWRASNYWGLVVLPPATISDADVDRGARDAIAVDAQVHSLTACDAQLSRALEEIRAAGFSTADAILGRVRDECPTDAGPLRELAAVHFAEHRWRDAAALATESLARDPRDAYALDLLGSSLFMQDDQVGALRAWNGIGKPRVNLMRIEGIRHARYQAIAAALDLHPNMLLTAARFERARRRLDELPDRVAARLAFRPDSDGFATVDVVVVERAGIPHDRAALLADGADAAIEREAEISIPGRLGDGETWTAKWRWWQNRPELAFAFTAPRWGAMPGIWRVDAAWDTETYAAAARSALTRRSRTHAGVTISDWLTGRVRYSIGGGLDVWDDDRKMPSLRVQVERRFDGDRFALSAAGETWMTSGPAVQSADVRLRFRSASNAEGWVYSGDAVVQHVSDAAPLLLWPGAGEGRARSALARAHPLLDGGVIDLDGGSLFGRSLVDATIEAQRWLDRPHVPRIAIAGFTDAVHVSRRMADAASTTQVDVGLGLRIKIPGASGVLRVDAARGVVDGAHAITVGWQY